jgi:death-on-curing protein
VSTVGISLEVVRQISIDVGGGGIVDENGVLGVLGRPFAGSVDQEYYPSIWGKAAALLHGFATTQYLEDGNKRTAWVVAKTFLLLNDVRIPALPAVQPEALMHAAAAGTFSVESIAEWLQMAHGVRADGIFDSRLEYLILAAAAQVDEGGATVSMASAGLAGIIATGVPDGDLALAVPFAVCGRVHWTHDDGGKMHDVTARLLSKDGDTTALAAGGWTDMPVIPSGFTYQASGRIPALFTIQLMAVFDSAGQYVVELLIDGQLAGTRTFTLTVQGASPLDE